MAIYNLGKQNSIANVIMRELRDSTVHQDRARFRQNIYKLGQIAAYEISKELNYKEIDITTPLADAKATALVQQPVLATILRAGLPLYEGLLSYLDKADSAFISAYRKHDKFDGFQIAMNSISCPNINDRTVIVCDPMLATGQSLVKTLDELKEIGKPLRFIIATVISSDEGIAYVSKQYPNVDIYTFNIDPELNAKSYIVPGLGDAGDLCFGPKIQE